MSDNTMVTKTHTGVGRNDPCSCGSGRKFKKCCLNASKTVESGSGVLRSAGGAVIDFPSASFGSRALVNADVSVDNSLNPGLSSRASEDLKAALENQEFESIEAAQTFVNAFMERGNRAGLPEFHGLSPEQMHRLINEPFDSPSLLQFPDDYLVDDTVPYVLFFNKLLNAVAGAGLKPTATGNLPRNLCRSVALTWLGDDGYAERTRYGGINSETDFREINGFRYVCEFAGYLRKYRGKFIIGSECQQLLKTGGQSAVYRGLFKSFIKELDWGFSDRYPDALSLIQHFWAFSIYLLQRYGDEWRPSTFYEEAFLNAFPAVANLPMHSAFQDPESLVKNAYRLRILKHWFVWFGLAEVENLEPTNMISTKYRVRKTPLADQVVVFNV
jgi:hypothetical protein